MDISSLLRGLLIGLSVAAAVGPMSVLCIQRTIHKGFPYGIVLGLGIATADGLYGQQYQNSGWLMLISDLLRSGNQASLPKTQCEQDAK